MADNTLLNLGTGGDTTRTIDRGTAKTQVAQIDVGGASGESLLVRGQQTMALSVPVVLASNQASIPITHGVTESDATAAVQPSGGSGVRGWLSGIYSTLLTTLKVAIQQIFTYSTVNSTNGASTAFSVATGSSWNGAVESALSQNYMTVGVTSTQPVTLTISQYLDAGGTTKDVPDILIPISSGIPSMIPVAVLGNYVKLSIVNSSGATASVVVDTYYGPLPPEPSTLTTLGNKKVAILESVTIPTTSANPAAIISAQVTVATSAAALAANALTNGIVITASTANAGTVYVGPTGVTTATGYPLAAGQSISYGVTNSNAVFVIAAAAGNTIAWTGN